MYSKHCFFLFQAAGLIVAGLGIAVVGFAGMYDYKLFNMLRIVDTFNKHNLKCYFYRKVRTSLLKTPGRNAKSTVEINKCRSRKYLFFSKFL